MIGSIDTNGHLDLDMGNTSIDQKVYHSIIGSLLYLCAYSPNIMLSVYVCKISSHTKACHLRVVKRIMRYLVPTPNLVLWYPKGSLFDLIGYSDADYAGCKVDIKSTFETCQFLGQSLVSWSSKKQNSVALSMTEAEYVTTGSCCAQLLCTQQTLKDYGDTMNLVPVLCDNKSAIKIAYNSREHSRTKHIDFRHHFLRDHAIKGNIIISHVRTNEQLANIFFKPLDEKIF
jgi:hypothetical protein